MSATRAATAGHAINIGSVRSPSGFGWQAYARCDCGWVNVQVTSELVESAARKHVKDSQRGARAGGVCR